MYRAKTPRGFGLANRIQGTLVSGWLLGPAPNGTYLKLRTAVFPAKAGIQNLQ